MKKTAIAAALLLVTGAANADTVTSITVTGGHFSMGQSYTSATCTSATAVDFGSCHEIAPGTANVLSAGDTGTALAGTGAISPAIAAFNFFGAAQVTSGLAPSAAGAASANDWTSGFSGVTDTGAGTMDLNLGGFYANWNGTNFLQGTDSTGATLTANNGTTGSSSMTATGTISGNTFDIEWHSFIVGGAFDGQTGYWHFTGTFESTPDVAPVPVPAAVWLFGSGLVGLAGVARRRKAA